MVQQKVTLNPELIRAMDVLVSGLGYRSRSAFIRTAIEEKLRSEQKRLRETLRQRAYESFAAEPPEPLWGDLEGEDFEER